MNALRLTPVLVSMFFLAAARDAAGESWIRLVAILGGVALFTMCSGLVFRLPRLKGRYGV